MAVGRGKVLAAQAFALIRKEVSERGATASNRESSGEVMKDIDIDTEPFEYCLLKSCIDLRF